ncbi:MAG: zf-HC2 domain-containing protein [Thermoanaerobaculia bacterium]|nr:zf-HC2 domain-containing protein [Thermoanaerobaculia bacterium]
MSRQIDHGFDQALVSGYLDGELTQGEHQRVRLHLEDCAECRRLAEELAAIREATMSTTFRVPPDRGWDETPRGGVSRLLRDFGWMVIGLWVLGLIGFGLWKLATDLDDLWPNLLAFGFWFGFGLVGLSVLVDRLKGLKTDRYRRVLK